jgi:hypothetical protein
MQNIKFLDHYSERKQYSLKFLKSATDNCKKFELFIEKLTTPEDA